MTSSHIFYIPLVFLLGLILGIMLGRRSAVVQREEEERLARRRAARQRERDAVESEEGPRSDAVS